MNAFTNQSYMVFLFLLSITILSCNSEGDNPKSRDDCVFCIQTKKKVSKVSSKTEDAFNSTVSKLENQRAHLNEEVSHLMETLVEELKDCETVHYYPIPDSINSMIYGIDKDSQGNHIVYPNSFERLKAIAAKDFHHIKDTLIEIIRQGPKLKRAAATLMMIRRGGWEVLMRHHPQYSGGTFCFTGATLYSK